MAELIMPPKMPKNPGICCPDCAAETAKKRPTATAPIENQERPRIRAIAATRN
ncbi:MAG: hypothetical protein ACLPGW_12255 [Roseiarcus sp.]